MDSLVRFLLLILSMPEIKEGIDCECAKVQQRIFSLNFKKMADFPFWINCLAKGNCWSFNFITVFYTELLHTRKVFKSCERQVFNVAFQLFLILKNNVHVFSCDLQ